MKNDPIRYSHSNPKQNLYLIEKQKRSNNLNGLREKNRGDEQLQAPLDDQLICNRCRDFQRCSFYLCGKNKSSSDQQCQFCRAFCCH